MTGRIANGPANEIACGLTGGLTGGLAAELRRCLAEWSRRTGIAVETWALPAGEVPPRAARAVPAALREALTLAGREAAAVSLVSVAVTCGDRGLRVTVSDNGAGLPVDESGPEVTAMRAAFAAAGGTISVRAVPGEGTTVTGVLPPR
ncbi:hypothetical protein SMD20_11590 [Nonomuraea sp. LP-02]|uniref:ATP-binding protein n=1 Tax=Nonomuraea sp. LP-02 TaxID=3097960 RepID=UPI002E345E6C|nr:ATP-binding protein [Nonomuraea sp. LP-02]MED7924883.1 hypothetical protein [Nonomuraea sp. LP-02]